jgi:hypothetical protein
MQTALHVPGGENKKKKYKIANDHSMSATKPAEGRPALMPAQAVASAGLSY